jgi:UDP-glucose 4-epimerase
MTGLRGKSILITGAGGFIGTALAHRFRAAGVTVHGTSRRARIDGDVCDRWWRVDLQAMPDVRRVLDRSGADIVVHLASVVSGSRDIETVLTTLHANLVATVNMLVAATKVGVERILVAGSLEEPAPASAWPIPVSPYAAAKFGAVSYTRMCHALYGTPAVWLRLFMVYGPGQQDVRKLVPAVTVSLLRGEAPAVSSGRRPVDWIYVDDVVDAFLAAAVAKGVEGRTPEIGTGTLVTVREVVERLVQIVNPSVAPHFGALPDRPFEQVRSADLATAECLDWRPRIPLEEGLRRTVEWYRRHSSVLPADEGGRAIEGGGR